MNRIKLIINRTKEEYANQKRNLAASNVIRFSGNLSDRKSVMWAHFSTLCETFDQTLMVRLATEPFLCQIPCWTKMFDRLAGAFKDLELKWKRRTLIQSYTPALMRPNSYKVERCQG